MHILFLTDNFPPEVNAPASRTYEHAREWVKAGHQVTVITCAPNFPKGKVFEGYRNRLRQTEDMSGVRVIRVWTYITANEGFFRRTLDYLSFMAAAVLAAPSVRKPDIVVATSPQFFTACAGWMVGALRRIPFVFELRDLWPESIRAVGAMRDGPVLRLLERIEMFLYRRAALIVSVTHAFKTHLTQRGIDPGKIAVITNGVDISRFAPRLKDTALAAQLGLENMFVAGYIGTHGLAHGLETLLDAAERLQSPRGGGHIRLLFLGDGSNKKSLVESARARGLGNVIFLDSVKKDEVVRYWSLLDAAIIHLRRDDLFLSVIPSKLFECMGMGIPVLHGVAGESARIVEAEGVGLLFEPGDADTLYGRIMELAGDTALRAGLRDAGLCAAPRYGRQTLALAMLEHLARAAGNDRSGQSEPVGMGNRRDREDG